MNKRTHFILIVSSLLMAVDAWADSENTVEATVSAGERKTFVSTMTVKEADQPVPVSDPANQTQSNRSRVMGLRGSIVEVNAVQSGDSSANMINLVIGVNLDQRYTMPLTLTDRGQTFKLGDLVSVTGNFEVDGEGDQVFFLPTSLYSQGKASNLLNRDSVKLSKAAALAESPEVEMMRVHGPVDWYTKVTIQGLDEQDEVIRVHMIDGTTDLIHLGKGLHIFKLNLEKGNVIEALGEEKMIDGKVILFARELYIDGESKL